MANGSIGIGAIIDALTEFIYNGANFMLGYMVSAGGLVAPSRNAWIVAGLTGLLGAANHLRALRKATA